MDIVIVESPVKSKTINKYLQSLGVKNMFVIATRGHVKEMPTKEMSVSYVDGEYVGKYNIIPEKKEVIEKIKSMTKTAQNIFCCQDDDREGERIAEDVAEVCGIKKYYRVTFREITPEAIKKALVDKENIRLINEQIVIAQKTRRLIDRLIGWRMQPAIYFYFNKKYQGGIDLEIKKGIGRVSGYALATIYRQELNIEEFNEKEEKDKESYVILARYNSNGVTFTLKGKNLEFKRDNYAKMQEVLQKAQSELHEVAKYNPAFDEVAPYPAFTTAKIYSACSFVFRISPKETNKILQDLFERGYITYPRTDSVFIDKKASSSIVNFLQNVLPNKDYVDILVEQRKYKNEKGAQEGHPAIYPIFIDIEHSPNHIASTQNNAFNDQSLVNSL